MSGRRAVRALVLGGLAILPLVACSAPTVRLSSKRMCEAAGGTYQGTQCAMGTGAPRAARQVCEVQGGIYMTDIDACELESTQK